MDGHGCVRLDEMILRALIGVIDLDVTRPFRPLALSWKQCPAMHVARAIANRPAVARMFAPAPATAILAGDPPVAPDRRRCRGTSWSLGIYCVTRDGSASWPHLSGVIAMATASAWPASPARGHMNDRDNTRRRHISRSTPALMSNVTLTRARPDRPDRSIRHLLGPQSAIRSVPRCNLKPRPAGGRRGVATAALRSTDPAAGVARV